MINYISLCISSLPWYNNKERIKGKSGAIQGVDSCPSLHLGVVAIEKEAFGLPSAVVTNFIRPKVNVTVWLSLKSFSTVSQSSTLATTLWGFPWPNNLGAPRLSFETHTNNRYDFSVDKLLESEICRQILLKWVRTLQPSILILMPCVRMEQTL